MARYAVGDVVTYGTNRGRGRITRIETDEAEGDDMTRYKILSTIIGMIITVAEHRIHGLVPEDERPAPPPPPPIPREELDILGVPPAPVVNPENLPHDARRIDVRNHLALDAPTEQRARLRSEHYYLEVPIQDMYTFEIRREEERITIFPVRTPSGMGFRFEDEQGNLWVNSIRYSMIRHYRNYPIWVDAMGLFWMLNNHHREASEEFNATLRNNTIVGTTYRPSKPRKKLRKKYGEMPVIKEESYYANSKFIA